MAFNRIPTWTHVVAYALLLLVVAGFTDLTSSWTSDDGAYAIQTRLANDTPSWGYEALPSWAPPPEEHQTIVNSQVAGGVEFPYAKHPIWIDALRIADRMDLPVVGLYVFSLLGALVAAWAASKVTVGTASTQAVAFWVVAFGPPLVWATGLWAHAPAAGLGGITAIGLARWVTRGDGWALVILSLSAGVCALLRSDGLLLALGIVAALAATSWWGDRRLLPLSAAIGSITVTLGLARFVEARRLTSIAHDLKLVTAPPGSGSWLAGRFSGFSASFVDAGYFNGSAVALGLIGLALLAVGAFGLRRGGSEPAADIVGHVVVLSGAAVLGVRYLWFSDDLVPGVLAASPILMLGLVTTRWSSSAPVERVLSVLVGAYATLVIATQYPIGGGADWGGRFLAPVFVAAVALAVGGLGRAIAVRDAVRGGIAVSRSWQSRAWVATVGAALILLPVVPAMIATNKLRSFQNQVATDIEATGAPVAIGLYSHSTRLAWRTLPEVAWAVTTPDDARHLVLKARNAGEEDLVVIGGGSVELTGLGFDVEEISPYVRHLTVERAPEASEAVGDDGS